MRGLKHRWSLGGACYVNIGQAPGAIWRAYKRGAYADAQGTRLDIGRNRTIRLGAYGDPAAVPAHVWLELIGSASGHTGDTHQWRNPVASELRALCMASVDSETERAEASALGWRTFRVRCADDGLASNEFECVSDTKGTACADCLACDGAARGPRQASVAIVVHGAMRGRFERAA